MIATAHQPFLQPGVVFDEGPHCYTFGGAPVLNVTTILRAHKISANWSAVDADVLERKRAIGKAAHAASHYFDEGDLVPGTVAPEVTPYLDAYRRFKEENDFEPLLLETMLVHPTMRYAGTIDRWGIVHRLSGNGMPSIVDLKTGDPEDAGAGPQTAAYEQLVRAQLPEILAHLEAQPGGFHYRWTVERLVSEPWDRYSVQLLPTGHYKLHPYTSFTDLRRFNCALTLEASAHPSWSKC